MWLYIRRVFYVSLLLTILQQNANAQSACSERGVETFIDIKTTPDALWQLLISFDKYPEWHPYLIQAEGAPTLKNKITFTYVKQDSTQDTFKAYILEATPDTVLSWGGSIGFIFNAKHYYRIDRIDSETVRLTQGEYWHGIFGRSYGKKVYQDACANFQKQNQIMKAMLENN